MTTASRLAARSWRKNQGFVDAIEFTRSGRYLFQTIWTKTMEKASILDASTGLEKFRPNVPVDGVLPSSDILVVSDERRSSLLAIDTQSYLTSAPDGYVVALFPGATHFVASSSEAGDMRLFGNGKCVKLRGPESANVSLHDVWRGNKTLSAEIRIGDYRREWVLDRRPKALAVWQANDGVLTTLLKLTGNDEFSYNYHSHIPPEVEYRSSRNPGGYFQIDPITGGVGPFRHGEARNYAEIEFTTKVRVKLGDAGADVTMYALTRSVTRTRRGTLALIRENGPFWVLNQSDGHAVELPGHWPNFAWFQRVQFSPSGNLVAVVPTFKELLIYDTRTGALLAEMDFGPRFDYADVIAFADPARELLVYTKRGRLFRFSLDESFPP